MMLRPAIILFALAAAAGSASAGKGLTIDDMLAMQRISEPEVSPDGKQVVFSVRDTDVDANRGRYDVWIASVDGKKAAERLTTDPENDQSPVWSPDGATIFYLSSRSGSSQVWKIAADGGEAEQVLRPAGLAARQPRPRAPEGLRRQVRDRRAAPPGRRGARG